MSTESTRLVTEVWTKYVEQGDYGIENEDIADCSICGKKQVECVILKSPTHSEPLNICISCSGGSD